MQSKASIFTSKLTTVEGSVEKLITLTTTSTSAAWTPSEVLNNGATLIWEVTGGVIIGEQTIDKPTFNLSTNSGTANLIIKSTTNFAGLDKIKVASLDVTSSDLDNASELTVYRINDNSHTVLDVSLVPFLQYLYANNNSLTSGELDDIVNDLDTNEVINGTLQISGNSGSLSSSAFDGYNNLVSKGWNINVAQPPNPTPPPIGGTTPIIGNFSTDNTFKNRVNFESSKDITGLTHAGFIISGKTLDTGGTPLFINGTNLTGHYFTVTVDFDHYSNNTIRLESGNGTIIDFTMQLIEQNILEPAASTNRFVTTTGSDSNLGTNDTTDAWLTIDHGMTTITNGQTCWVKIGTYTSGGSISGKSGTVISPRKLKGYISTPGDIDSMYYTYGIDTVLDNTEMPLIDQSDRSSGSGILLTNCDYWIIENFQITGSLHGIQTSGVGGSQNVVIKNCLIKDVGTTSGTGILTNGSTTSSNRDGFTRIEDCLVINAASACIRMQRDYNRVINCKAYGDDNTGDRPPDYYININKSSNSIINGCYVERVGNLTHRGHGLSFKEDGEVTEYNLTVDCGVKNIKGGVEFRQDCKFSVARNITFTNGFGGQGSGVRFRDGATFNIAEDCTMTGLDEGMRFYETRENGRTSAGDDNIMRNCVFDGCTTNIVTAVASGITDLKTIKRNEFQNCTFRNSTWMFQTNQYQLVDNTNLIKNCIIEDVGVENNPIQPYTNDSAVTYSNHYNFWGTNGVPESGTGNTSVDPTFTVFPTPTNASLKAGIAVTDVEYDKDGTERADPPTMGAIEI